MDMYKIEVENNNVGGYFSSEQIEMLTIVQCKTHEELVSFIYQCRQLSGIYTKDDLYDFANYDLEELKRRVFKTYQNTLVPHNSNRATVLDNTLTRIGLAEEDVQIIKRLFTESKKSESMKYISEYLKNKYPNNYEEMFIQVQRFVSLERDQNMNPELYDEMVLLNNYLSMFDTLLVGSGKIEVILNELLDDNHPEKFDFYHIKRDLDFAFQNNKHIRFHSLLTKGANEKLFKGRTKEEVLDIMRKYIKVTIDFVNEYNKTHKLSDGTPVINAIDLFNEIVSFDINERGEYFNIWEEEYGITIQDIGEIFEYAKKNKPEGVNYLYNEPFLEDSKRRKKVIEVLNAINEASPGMIDTLGSQMHITFGTSIEQIEECFKDLKKLQDEQKMNVQITEFDLSLSERETLRTIGETPEFTHDQVYEMKAKKMADISTTIKNSGVELSGISYWSLTDKVDCNLERVRTNLLKKDKIKNINEVTTTCGGLIPTTKSKEKTQTNSESLNNESKKSNK